MFFEINKQKNGHFKNNEKTTNNPRTMHEHVTGVSIKIDKYEETRAYGTHPRVKKMESPKAMLGKI